MTSNKIDITITPPAGDRTYRLSLPKRMVWLALVGLGLIVAGLITSLAMYGRVAVVAGRAETLARENERLRGQAGRIADLAAEVDRLRSLEAKMLGLMGIDTLHLGRGRYQEGWPSSASVDSSLAPGEQGLIWPAAGAIARGYRPDLSSGTPHLGLDIAGRAGAPVKAARGGRVTFAGQDPVFGNMVVVDHGGGITTLYGHNSELLVKEGDFVLAGETIARLGSTGRSSAPHLHFEVREGDTPVDPLKYLRRK